MRLQERCPPSGGMQLAPRTPREVFIEPIVEKTVQDLLCPALETEMGGVAVYRMAVLCAEHEALKKEWQKYLEQTERHVEIVRGMLEALGLDPEMTTLRHARHPAMTPGGVTGMHRFVHAPERAGRHESCFSTRSQEDSRMARTSSRRYGRKASQKVERAVHEMKRGKLRSGGSGKKVTSRKQAVAIGLSQARREGGKVPSRRRARKAS